VVSATIGHGPGQILRIIRAVLRSDIVIAWFASVYGAFAALIAALFGKRSVIIVGGVDVAKEREYGYGLWLSPWKSWLVANALRRADKVLVVDESLKHDVVERAGYGGDNIEVLPTGYDETVWYPIGKKEQVVLTVAAVQTMERFMVKGIDLLIETARKLPEVTFLLVGVERELIGGTTLPPNLELIPPVGQTELLSYYRKSKVYCQPSRREGLSNTLCEAMLSGCIPVATDVGGSAKAVGEMGVIVSPNNPEELSDGIRRALLMPQRTGEQGRERIISLFPKSRREQRLLQLMRDLS